MSKKFIRLTSGWIPVSVLLLCAAALISSPGDASSRGDSATGTAPVAPVAVPRSLDPDERAGHGPGLDYAESVLPLTESIGLALGAAGQFTTDDVRLPGAGTE